MFTYTPNKARYIPPLTAAAVVLNVSEKELKAVLLRFKWIERGVFPIQATRNAEILGYVRQVNGVNEYGKTYSRFEITARGISALNDYFKFGFSYFIHT